METDCLFHSNEHFFIILTQGQHDHSWSNPAFNTCIQINKLKLLVIIGIDTTTLSWGMMCIFQNTQIKGQKKVETFKHLNT